jgi:hypothetical protein
MSSKSKDKNNTKDKNIVVSIVKSLVSNKKSKKIIKKAVVKIANNVMKHFVPLIGLSGPPGPRGPPGPPGPGTSPAFIYASSFSDQSVPNNMPVMWSTTTPSTGITESKGIFTITVAGTYKFNFVVRAATTVTFANPIFDLANSAGVHYANTSYITPSPNAGVPAGDEGLVAGLAIIVLSAAATVQLRNVSTVIQHLPAAGDGNGNSVINAAMQIELII